FQDYALFPYLTVEQNVAFGLRGLPPALRREKVRQALALVQLEGLEDRHPRALSGGQQQRVGLARALATNPDLLLLDEPLSALDAPTRSQIQGDLLRALQAFARPVVLVTHDIAEACTLGDRIAVFAQGQVIQVGGREEILRHPASRAVAELTGGRNLLEGRFLELRRRTLLLEWEGHTLEAPLLADFPRDLPRGAPLHFCIRPEHVMLLRDSAEETAGSEINRLRGVVVDETPRGITFTLAVRVVPPSVAPRRAPIQLEVEVSSQVYEVLELKGRKEWTMAIRPSAIHVFRPA
ncbi:MAG: ABC transporter ATP-binding protein, partial [Deltaproteobacteria bacterium]|nr:ABC transporter ATP-binding protein [Deltaproteobacteria bacterium]